ncbi:DUF4399 domain-containing protein [Roseivirga sp. E12]|uniref:DUF4399 domain-containing protein n=1 Tax=Roseivirga sp. E12 TaxID=2819237 RepID=UPI001ABC0CC8|nr:DUF4399 domain-containing protein [Roseivirga sp. E12]MBO3697049.1 DUF4399 domain-containing protein [Roseivirga sp. E12]
MKIVKSLCLLIVFSLAILACGQKDGVYFENLNDGQEVGTSVLVKMGVSGMEIKPAGEIVKGTGHHHMIIDGASIKTGDMVPANKTHIHFGKGQTETTLDLAPGEHTLTLQFANGVHQSYGSEWSKTITITVK